MNLKKANLAELMYLARFTEYREAAIKELEARENEFNKVI